MKLAKTLSLGLIAISCSTAQMTATAFDLAINYKNQRGSTMALIFQQGKQENTGILKGKFTTAVGNCKADVGVPLPIAGYYNGNAVTIAINFPHCKQVVAMTGNMINNQRKLHTLWLDAAPVEDPRGNDWNSNITGSDIYHRVDKV